MKVLSGVPSGISTRPVLVTLPTSEKTLVPALLALPVSVNHAGPLATMGAMLYQVSTLLMLLGLPRQPFLRGERRARPRPSGFAFERGDQRGLLAADECARAFHQFDIEIESAAQNVASQQAVVARLLDGPIQAVHGQRILGAHVDDALGCARHVAADDHAFQQRVRIALDLVAVHVGAGIALVGIADDVFGRHRRLAQELPLECRWRYPAPPRPRSLAALICSITDSGLLVDQHLVQRLVAADGDVFLDIVGIDEPAVAQHDLLLALEERHVVPQAAVREAGAIADVRR